MCSRTLISGTRSLLLLACLCLGTACAGRKGVVHPELAAAADRQDVLALSDALEALIGAGRDTPADREYAYEIVRAQADDTAASQYARASVTGRLVQQKGLRAANLVPEIERSARRSRDLDPEFRDGAATRLLGTLYVMAPGALLEHGDSETGIELLEGQVQTYPDAPENHVRLAEAYIALHDPDPAAPHLCYALAHKATLRPDDQRLLAQLVSNAGLPSCGPATAPEQ